MPHLLSDEYWTHERLKPKNWDGREVIAYQVKMDGHRVTFFKQDDGELVCFGRKDQLEFPTYDWWFHVRDVLPPRSSLDCELYVPFRPASYVSTREAEETGQLRISPFAMPWFAGRDLSLTCPLEHAERIRSIGLHPPAIRRWDEVRSPEYLRAHASEMKIEGWVLKEHAYAGWWKCKPTSTVDCIVLGMTDGEGKYLGEVGALELGLRDPAGLIVEIGRCSGMTDAEREAIVASDVGRVVEVEYSGVGSRGRLIWPRFVRFRDDKPAEECLLEDLT